MNALALHEWRDYDPASTPELAARYLADASARRVAQDLAKGERLTVLELRDGLHLSTSSFVGTIRLGDLRLSIQPKIQGLPLLNLLRYAYGLRDLALFEALQQGVSEVSFQDLLIHQLLVEVTELLSRGLQRRYERTDELLASPRGRISFNDLAQQMGAGRAALPCTHHPRREDTPHNRAVLAGLQMAARLTGDLSLRSALHRQAALLEDSVTAVRLGYELMEQVARQSNRLTATYEPSLTIIDLLLEGQGTALDAREDEARVPGFLFDMNRFFQALISRFLHEHLPGYTVRDEHRLVGMLAYDPQRNPRGHRAPSPRPDFVVMKDGRIAAMLDAKYRDLWEQPLPREMLYQLVIYATSRESGGRAAILYPTLDDSAQEMCIKVRSPLSGHGSAEVLLRPVSMSELERLVAGSRTTQREREAAAYAARLAFGA